MDTKPLLYGLIGFFLGGLIVSLAATYLDDSRSSNHGAPDMTMSEMSAELRDKSGDDYDQAFLIGMIAHHEGALEMAKLSESRAKHPEIKQLSRTIIAAQEEEIHDMRQWQSSWGYVTSGSESMDKH